MTTFDAHANFALTSVLTAPNPATSGTSLVVAPGTGALFPVAPFNATVWPAGAVPTALTAEIVRVSNVTSDTLTIARTQEGTPARAIIAGDQIMASITKKTITDIETAVNSSGSGTVQSVTAGDGTVTIGGTSSNPTVKVAGGTFASFLIASSQQTGSTYTFVLADNTTVVEGNSASAQTFTIPPHSSVAYPVGATIEVFQYGAGQITVAAGVGVTLRSDGARVATAAQYATIGLRQRAQDEWVLSGDLA